MIFPTDYRQRLVKEEKSRQYKAMLDEQIRQNSLINQEVKMQRRNNRIRTQPIQPYRYPDRATEPTRQLRHQSTFLPSIAPNHHIIDHSFKYLASPSTPSRRFANLSAQKYASKKYNDEALDDDLDRCLDECDQLINGINKNFINLNSHLRNKNQRINSHDSKNYNKSRHYSSDFDIYNKGQDSRISKGADNHLPVTSLKSSQLFGIDSDVGRNEMMNFHMQKARQKQILHISTPGDSSYNPIDKDQYQSSMHKSGSKTKRKNINQYLGDKFKTTPNKKSHSIDFQTLNSQKEHRSASKLQNQFIDVNLPHSMSAQLNQSIEKMKKDSKRMALQLKEHQQMKKKDNKILEHLRKAKNKGSILFKKIQVFRKQREDLENSQNQNQQQKNVVSANKSKAASRNTQKNIVQSRNSILSQQNKIDSSINKGEVSVAQKSRNENYKQEPKPSQLNSRANSKVSQKE